MPPKKTRSITKKVHRVQKDKDEDGTQMEQRHHGATRRRRLASKSQETFDQGSQQGGALADNKEVQREFMNNTLKLGIPGLVAQFIQIKRDTMMPPVKTAQEAHPDRNRYKDVFCADEHRCVLTWPPGNPMDYIHANYVHVRKQKLFICTQAPIEKTVDDFWRLVWQEKSQAIVMLCNIMEKNKKKCELYWPDKPGAVMNLPCGLTVKCLETNSDVDKFFPITKMEVSFGSDTLDVVHHQWVNWPDRGVPNNIMGGFRMLKKIKGCYPAIIHCSAGIGRTGTIVGLEMAYQYIENNENFNFETIVRELRSYRHGSVQNEYQYVYMHRCVLNLIQNHKVAKFEEMKTFIDAYEQYIKSQKNA